MTKKDYEIIAAAFAYTKEQEVPSIDNETVDSTARFMAMFLEMNNPKFDRVKFLTACGVN